MSRHNTGMLPPSQKPKTMVWICGQLYVGKPSEYWEFQGVFSDEQSAVKACRTCQYFITPVVMDEKFPENTFEFKDSYFPIDKPPAPEDYGYVKEKVGQRNQE